MLEEELEEMEVLMRTKTAGEGGRDVTGEDDDDTPKGVDCVLVEEYIEEAGDKHGLVELRDRRSTPLGASQRHA